MSLDHAWLKGVPMELRPRYYPKPPLRFKDIDIYIPLDAIENDVRIEQIRARAYDFTEERRVLAESKMYEEYKENERLAEEERQRLLAIQAERLRLEEEERERLRQQEEEELEHLRLLHQEEIAKELALAAAAAESADNNATPSSVDNPSAFDDDGQPPPPTYQEALSKENEHNLASPTATTTTAESPSSTEHQKLPTSSSSHHLTQQQPEASASTSTAAPTPSESETAVISPHNGYQYSDIQLPMYHQHHHHQPIQSYYNYYAALPPQPQQQPPPPPHQIQATTSVPPLQFQHQATSQSLGGGSSGGILQPQPPPPPPGGEASASASGAGSPSGSDKSSASQTHPHNPPHPPLSKKVDLSDFESDTANPFDNVELKSINDMEVLASVLKNNMNINTNPTNLPHQQQHQLQHSHSSSASESSHQNQPHPPPYVNGYERGPPPTYFHQPTPIYPPVSQHQQQQCPYPSPAWNQNGYYPLPTSSASTPVVPVTNATTGGATAPPPHHLNQNRPVSTGSHIPSPTPTMEQNHVNVPPPRAPTEVNSFTKQHFPFLTSMAATQARRDRDVSLTGGYGGYGHHHRGYAQSTEEITSQNPFLSNYISSSSAPPHPQQLSHSPMQHQHQYWPTQLQPTQQQNLYPLNHNSGVGAGTTPQGASGGALDPQNQSQHALR